MAERKRRKFERWIALQRKRALLLVSLRDLNERLEGIRPALGADAPLDGFTPKLGGTDEMPGLSGLWLEQFIRECLLEQVLHEDDLIAA
jgi:hypothetical protein